MQTGPCPPVLHKKQTFGETFCGADLTTYKWSQTISDLDITVPLSKEITSAANLDVETSPEYLTVKIKKPGDDVWSTVIDGALSFETKPTEMIWSFERGQQINIHLEKVKEKWWDSLLKDEPKINLEALELSRPVSDLTEEEEMTLQKVWSQQLKKRHGPEGGFQSDVELGAYYADRCGTFWHETAGILKVLFS